MDRPTPDARPAYAGGPWGRSILGRRPRMPNRSDHRVNDRTEPTEPRSRVQPGDPTKPRSRV